MKMHIFRILILFGFQLLSGNLAAAAAADIATADPGQHLYPNIKKLSEGLYTAKMLNGMLNGLNLVMERVTDLNVARWKHYGNMQLAYVHERILQEKFSGI
jgi:hypothetical protein